MTLLEKQSLI